MYCNHPGLGYYPRQSPVAMASKVRTSVSPRLEKWEGLQMGSYALQVQGPWVGVGKETQGRGFRNAYVCAESNMPVLPPSLNLIRSLHCLLFKLPPILVDLQVLTTEFLRKYVVYSRRKYAKMATLEMDPQALDDIASYYIELRSEPKNRYAAPDSACVLVKVLLPISQPATQGYRTGEP